MILSDILIKNQKDKSNKQIFLSVKLVEIIVDFAIL